MHRWGLQFLCLARFCPEFEVVTRVIPAQPLEPVAVTEREINGQGSSGSGRQRAATRTNGRSDLAASATCKIRKKKLRWIPRSDDEDYIQLPICTHSAARRDPSHGRRLGLATHQPERPSASDRLRDGLVLKSFPLAERLHCGVGIHASNEGSKMPANEAPSGVRWLISTVR